MNQYKILLKFEDKEIENKYRLEQEHFLAKALRNGLIMSLGLWGISIPLLRYLTDVYFITLAISIIVVNILFFIPMILTTYKNRFLGHFHLLSASSNLLAGILLMLIFYFVKINEFAILTSLIFLIFFGLYSYRFRTLTSVGLSFLYMLMFQIYISLFSEVEIGNYVFMSFYAWATVGFSFIVSQVNEKSDRNAFINKIVLEEQNITLLQQKEEIQAQADYLRDANTQITEQKNEIEHKNNEITSSITYASRIQHAIIPRVEDIKQLIGEYFILWLPRDIVSGDFYWVKELRSKLIVVVADCTGHGVPGAFMSMLGVAFLNEIVRTCELNSAGHVLDEMRNKVKEALMQTGKMGEQQDGMDVALCIYDFENKILSYSGANNPLYIIRNKRLTEYKATKNPIGIYLKEKPFHNYSVDVKKGDALYMFSDGYVDQFGGNKGRKYMSKYFKEKLIEISDLDMNIQNAILHADIKDWMGDRYKQNDDILVIGIRI